MSTHLTALGLTLLHAGWQALVIAALYRLADLCLTRLGERARYRLGIAAMLAVLASALATFVYEEIRLAAHPAAASVLTSLPVTSTITQWLPWVDMVWAIGVAVLSLRLAGGLWFIQGLKRAAMPVPAALEERFNALRDRLALTGKVELRLHPRISGPFVTGIVRSVVYLPLSCVTALTPEQLDAVLSHELEHVLRHDYLWNLLQSAIETLFFFHPAVWWIGNRLREQRELICDDAALSVCRDPITYATALLRLEEDRRETAAKPQLAPELSMALNGHRNNLFWRIARILDEDTGQAIKSSRLLRAAGAALSLPLAVALLAAFAPPVAQSAAKAAGKLMNAQQATKDTVKEAGKDDSGKDAVKDSGETDATLEDTAQSEAAESFKADRAAKTAAKIKQDFVIHSDNVAIDPNNPDVVAEITRDALIQAREGLKDASKIDPDMIAKQVRDAMIMERNNAVKHGRTAINPDDAAARARNEAIRAKAEALRAAAMDVNPDAIAAQVRADLKRDQAEIQRAKADKVKNKAFFWMESDDDASASDEVPAPTMPVAPSSAPVAPLAPTAPVAPPAPKALTRNLVRITPQKPIKVVLMPMAPKAPAPVAAPKPASAPAAAPARLGFMPKAAPQALPAASATDKRVYAITATNYAASSDDYNTSKQVYAVTTANYSADYSVSVKASN